MASAKFSTPQNEPKLLAQLSDRGTRGNRDRTSAAVWKVGVQINPEVAVERRHYVLRIERPLARISGMLVGRSNHLAHAESATGNQN